MIGDIIYWDRTGEASLVLGTPGAEAMRLPVESAYASDPISTALIREGDVDTLVSLWELFGKLPGEGAVVIVVARLRTWGGDE